MTVEFQEAIEKLEKQNPHLLGDEQAISKLLVKRLRIAATDAEQAVADYNAQRADALLAKGPEELLRILQEDNLKRAQGTGMLRTCIALVVILTMISVVYSLFNKKEFDFVTLCSLLAVTGSGMAIGASGSHKLTAAVAAQLQDVRLIGPLLELLDSGDASLIKVLRNALLSLLPKVREGDEILLTTEQRQALVGWLVSEKDPSTATVILGSLRWLGDHGSIGILENVAKGLSPVIAKSDEKLQNQARMAVGELRLRLASERVLAAGDSSANLEVARAQLPPQG